jgi:hypothetical protein
MITNENQGDEQHSKKVNNKKHGQQKRQTIEDFSNGFLCQPQHEHHIVLFSAHARAFSPVSEDGGNVLAALIVVIGVDSLILLACAVQYNTTNTTRAITSTTLRTRSQSDDEERRV